VQSSTWHLSADAHFNLFKNGSATAIPITISKAATLPNASEADLAADLNAQLATHGITAVIQDSRIKFIAGASVTDFRIEAATTDTASKELGLGATQAAQNSALTASSSGASKLAVDPDDDGKAAEFVIDIGGSQTTVSVRQKDTDENTTRAHLVADVNDALIHAGLGGKIYAELSGSAIKLIAVDGNVSAFTLSTEAGDPAVTELGFSATATAVAGGAKTLVAAKDLRSSVGRFGENLSFDVSIGAGAPVTVNVVGRDGQTNDAEGDPIFTGVDTSANNSIFDLAADINRALRNAGLQLPLVDGVIDESSQLRVEAVGDRLLFTGGGTASFTITPNGNAAAALGLSAESSDLHDLVITTHDGATSFVTLDGATDLGHVIEKIVQATGGADFTLDRSDPTRIAGLTFGKVRVEFDETRTGLKFTDISVPLADPGEFMIVPVNGSRAALDLRIVGREGLEDVDGDGDIDADDGYGVIEGGQIAGVTLLDRFFLENAVIGADLLITSEPAVGDDPAVPEGISASATFGNFVTISLDGGATLTAGVEAGLKNPTTGELGGKVTLKQLIQGISNPSSIIQTPAFSASGSFDLGVSISPSLPGLIDLDALPRLTINIEDFGNPFAASATSDALSTLNLGSSSFDIKLNVPGVGERTITVSLNGIATTVTGLEDELNVAIQAALDADSALAAAFPAGVPEFIRANIVGSGGQNKLVLTALEDSGVNTFSIANAVGGAASVLGFDTNAFGALTNQIADLVPDIAFDFHDLGDLLKFDNLDFNFSAILDALIALSDFLDQFEAFGFLNEDLPLINMSVNDILDFADKLDAAVTAAQANPAGAIQQLEARLEQALGLASRPELLTLSLDEFDPDGVADSGDEFDMVKLSLALTTEFGTSVGVSIPEIDIPAIGDILDLGGSAELGVTATLRAQLDVGVSLENPTDVYVYNTTGLSGFLQAFGEDLNFRAALGPFGLYIKNGSATVAGRVAAGLDLDDDGDVDDGTEATDRILIGDLLSPVSGSFFDFLEADVSGNFDVVLPAFFPTNTSSIGDFEIHVGTGPAQRGSGDGLAIVGADEIDLGAAMSDIAVGDTVRTSSFGNAGNNGEFVVKAISGTRITVENLDGSATSFINEVAAGGKLVANLFNQASNWLEGFSLTDALTIPDFTDVDLSLGLFDSILLAIDGFDMFLGGLQDVMDGEVFGFELPFIGDKLSAGADFIQDFRDGFFADFRDFIQTAADMADNFTDAELNVISGLLFDLLGPNEGGLDLLKPLDAIASPGGDVKNPGAGTGGGSVDDYIRLTTDESGYVQWDFTIGGTAGIGTEVDFDFGVPGLGIEAEGGIGMAFDWDLDLGFGLSLAEGFYLNIADPNELAINVEVTLPSSLTGRLAFLQLAAVEQNVIGTDADGNTRLGLAFVVDINNKTNAADTRLGLAEFGKIGFDVGVAAEAVAELGLTLSLNSDLLGLSDAVAGGFPEITAGFAFDWGIGAYNYANFEASTFIDISTVGNAIKEGLRLVEFRDVSLDVGSFLSDVVGPIVKEVQKITAPIQPLIDILTTPLPVISDLGPPVTLLDLAGAFGTIDPRMIYSIADVISLINRIPDPDAAGALLINFGDFTIVGGTASLTTDITNPNFKFGKQGSGGALDGLLGSNNKNSLDFDSLLAGATGGSSGSKKTMQDLKGGNAGGGFSFPIFDDPSQIFGVLMGQPATLVAYDMAPLVFEFEWSAFFSIFGPLGVSVNVEFGADIDFDFGYDTLGIQQFVEGGFKNPQALLNGFFVGDLIDGKDVAEVELFGSLWAAAELNLGVARAGVGGGITAEIDFNLNDPDGDGKVRIMEIIGNIENQLNAPSDAEKLLAPLAMFDVSGRIFAELFAFLKIDLLFFSLDKKFNITPPIELITFDVDFFRPPKLATELDNGDLVLNMGDFAGDRLLDPREDIAEHFELRFVDANSVEVRATNLGSDALVWQEYDVTGKIIAVTGEGGDRITVLSGMALPFDFDVQGGAGDDIFDLANVSGEIRVRGDEGDDQISTGSGADILYGGLGNDILNAGDGFDIVFGDDDGAITGSNILVEVKLPDGNDTIDGQGDNDVVFGGGGNDTVKGGGGADIVIGDGGLVIMSAGPIGTWSVTNTERGSLGGNDTLHGNAGIDRLFGGKGNDRLDGGADTDHLFAQAGDDIAYGGSGADFIYGAEGNDVIYGKRGSAGGFLGDTLDTAEDGADEVYGGDGNDEIHGDDGDDVIFGAAGHDDIFGDAGRDSIFGQDGNDRIWGGDEIGDEAGALGDLIYGGAGDDIVDGGAGADLIYAGVGSDTIEGGEDGDTITLDFLGAKSNSLTVVTDGGTAGNDKIVVNTTDGNDRVLLRAHHSTGGTAFIALLNEASAVERVNYNNQVESFVVNTLFGDDLVAVDDTRAVGTVNLGLGDDRIQIGQIFRSQRDSAAGVAAEDVVATIETTRGFLSNGVSFDLTVNAGVGNDEFTVYHNLASLILNGNDGDDTFLIKAFALAGSQDNERGRMDLTGGGGADTIQYVINAPVFINGGDGFDTIVVIGTEFGDDFVITENGVFGAGLHVNFVNIEALRLDGAEGDDRFFVQSTNPRILTEIFGGLGSDTFSIAGDTPAVASNDLKGHSGLIIHDVESDDTAYDGLRVDGISANVADNDAPAIIVTPAEALLEVIEGATGFGAAASYTIVLSRRPTHEVTVTAQMPELPPDELARLFETIEFTSSNRVVDAQGKFSAAQLRFNADNWFIPQTVTVAAVDDLASEGPQQVAITHKVQSADTISGDDTDLLTVTETQLTVGSALFPTAGNGLKGAVVKLTSPTGYYQTRVIASNTATTLTLIGEKWQDLPESLEGYNFEIKRFDALAIPIVALDIVDNDEASVVVIETDDSTDVREPEVTITGTGTETQGEVTDSITVKLTRPSAESVTVALNAGDQVTLSQDVLVFAPGETEKTVTITPIADGAIEGFHFGHITATVTSADYNVVVTGANDSFAAPDPARAEEPRTSVDLSHVPVRDSVVVSVDGGGLPAGVQVQVVSNTVLFVNAAGSPVPVDGAISVTYSYIEPGYDGTPFRRVTAAITDADAPGVLITESNGSTNVIEFDALASGVASSFNQTQTQIGNAFSPNVLTFTFDVDSVPVGGAGMLTVSAIADLDLSSEFLRLRADGTFIADLFVTGGRQQQFVTTAVSLTEAQLEAFGSNGEIVFTVTPSASVNLLGFNGVALQLTFPGDTAETIENVGFPKSDTYEVVLTSRPTHDVIVNVRPEETVTSLLVDPIVQVGVDTATLTFTPENWYIPQVVTVSALDDHVVDGGDTQVFAPKLHTVNRVQGPLFLQGAGGEGSLSVADPLMLPGETNVKVPTGNVVAIQSNSITVLAADLLDVEDIEDLAGLIGKSVEITAVSNSASSALVGQFRLISGVNVVGSQVQLLVNVNWDVPAGASLAHVTKYAITNESANFFVNEEEQVDWLIVDDTDSVASFPATLSDATVDGYDVNLSGLGMGPETLIGDRLLPGGITYGNFEYVEVNMGKGNNPVTVNATSSRADFQTWTVLRTGAGDDVVTVGLHPDDITLFTGAPVASTTMTLTGANFGTANSLAGHEVQITAGPGAGQTRLIVGNTSDTLNVSRPWEVLPTAASTYEIIDDADGRFSVDTGTGNDQVLGSTSTLPLVVFGGAGDDLIRGGAGEDILFGDLGRVDFQNEAGEIVTRLGYAPQPADNGNFIPFIGVVRPFTGTVTASTAFTLTGGDLDDVFPTDPFPMIDGGLAGLRVFINAGTGIGQFRIIESNTVNTLTVTEKWNVDPDSTSRFIVFGIGENQTDGVFRDPNLIMSIDGATGGADRIDGNGGNDIVVGGPGADPALNGNGGDDVLVGDSGRLDYTRKLPFGPDDEAPVHGDTIVTVLRQVQTIHVGQGGGDTISGNAGADLILGGFGGDTIYGDNETADAGAADGADVLIGDNGELIYDDAADPDLATLDIIRSFADGLGGGDTISGDAGSDILLGGTGGDTLYGDNAAASNGAQDLRDYLLGDNGTILLVDNRITRLETTDESEATGGDDTISGNAASDHVLGGVGGDTIHGDAAAPGEHDGSDVILGDQGIFEYNLGTPYDGNPVTLDRVRTKQTGLGADDTIYGNARHDVILGGAAGDEVHGNTGNDLVLGDFGDVQFGTVTVAKLGVSTLYTEYALYATITDNDEGGADTIFGDADEDVIVGGAQGDDLDGGSQDDLIFGDNVTLDRRGALLNDFSNPRFREVSGALYGLDGNVQVGATPQNIPALTGTPVWGNWEIELVDVGFGNDYIAGGVHDDQIFGQLGDDTIQGDGSILGKIDDDNPVGAVRDGSLADRDELITVGTLQVVPSFEDDSNDGDDYIEGNGGKDVIFGNLGQDDIVGGSSDLFSLGTPDRRPDDLDLIFGGAGTDIGRNNLGDADLVAVGDSEIVLTDENGHARDADVILGDNGNIFRVVAGAAANAASTYRAFSYDDAYSGALRLIPRAVQLLDYTPGGVLGDAAASDIGAGDELHGESGDDAIYGQKGDDVLFGEGQNDDLIGGTGNDWISGGTGDDGVLGDDGRIYTSRNPSPEALYGMAASPAQTTISTAGGVQEAIINVSGELKKTVNLTPFSVDTTWDGNADEFAGADAIPHSSDDIIYGGWGGDWLHGGSGDDAISGAEALPEFYGAPGNPGNALGYDPATGTFDAYEEFTPLEKIAGFLLNFDATEGPRVGTVGENAFFSDGNDRIFGDLGNDWLVGGTGRDNLYGGWGDDLMNADDDHSTNGGLNDQPDTHPTYEDRAFGGAGRDVLIANTGGDRLIDWAGEFNSYLVPFAPFGLGTVSRMLQPQLAEFLYALSAADGADPTRSADVGGSADPARNGEPFGELGLVRQQDFAWQEQTGAPRDNQPGNIPGGARDVLRSANFDGASTSGFFADSGAWTSSGGVLQVQAASIGGDAVSVFHVGDALPGYFEIQASVMAIKPTGGWNANSYVIFDYQGEEDFKFAGIDVSTNKLVMGHRDASGWHVDKQAPVQGGVKVDKYYNVLLAVNGVNVTLLVDNKLLFTHTYQPRIVDGVAFGLNWGMVGVGSNNSRGAFDNIRVQILPPQVTLDRLEDFNDGVADFFTGGTTGAWSVSGGRYGVTPGDATGFSLLDLGPDHLKVSSYLELNGTVNAASLAGYIFDRYGDTSFKFVAIDAANDRLVIGHYTKKGGWVTDAFIATAIEAGKDYTLKVTLKGTTVSAAFNPKPNGSAQAIVGFAFNAGTVDGNFGLLATGGSASFDDVRVKTDDPAFRSATSSSMIAAGATASAASVDTVTQAELDAIASVVLSQWTEALGNGDPRLAAFGDVRFVIGDLGAGELGYAEGKTILIDGDGAGVGWYVDASPAESSEFRVRLDRNVLAAAPVSEAYGRFDLVTVVAHELGHMLGFDHDHAGHLAVMAEDLDPGVRYRIDTEQAVAEPRAAAAGTSSVPAFDLLAGLGGMGPHVGIDWQGEASGSWRVALSPYAPPRPAKAVSPNLAEFDVQPLMSKAASQDTGFDSLGRALLGKGKTDR